jgi:PTS system nitrogen regulatory IIA component
MSLASLTRPELILPDLEASDRAGVLRALAGALAADTADTADGVASDPEALYARLADREELGSTAVGSGVAIPHCKLPGLPREVVAVAVSRRGVDFGAADGRPVQVFFLVVSPPASPAEHLRVLAAISRWVKADGHVGRLLAAGGREDIYRLLGEEG